MLHTMIYDGKTASLQLQTKLKEQLTNSKHAPVLGIFFVATHPSIASFVAIKRRFASAVGITLDEHNFDPTTTEDEFVSELKKCIDSQKVDALIVQLPLPSTYNTQKILDMIPEELDVDVLGGNSFEKFKEFGTPLPPVAGAVAYILNDLRITLIDKKIVVVGKGKLVGEPVATWFKQQGIEPILIDINTPPENMLPAYKEADIVVSGIGKPHHLKKEFFKCGVILIDAGTSEQAGVLVGDFDPSCTEIASIITPVPGGIGPLTVACLFKNIIDKFK